MGHVTLLSDFIEKTLPATRVITSGNHFELLFQIIAAVVAIGGVLTAYVYYFNKPFPAAEPERTALQNFFYQGWDFDLLYNTMIVRPVVFLSRIDKSDFIDRFYIAVAAFAVALNKLFSATQNGKLRSYATVVAIGAVVILTIIFYL